MGAIPSVGRGGRPWLAARRNLIYRSRRPSLPSASLFFPRSPWTNINCPIFGGKFRPTEEGDARRASLGLWSSETTHGGRFEAFVSDGSSGQSMRWHPLLLFTKKTGRSSGWRGARLM